jgi:hypothetical protein
MEMIALYHLYGDAASSESSVVLLPAAEALNWSAALQSSLN